MEYNFLESCIQDGERLKFEFMAEKELPEWFKKAMEIWETGGETHCVHPKLKHPSEFKMKNFCSRINCKHLRYNDGVKNENQDAKDKGAK